MDPKLNILIKMRRAAQVARVISNTLEVDLDDYIQRPENYPYTVSVREKIDYILHLLNGVSLEWEKD